MTGRRYYFRARLVGQGPFIGVMTWHGLPWVDGEEVDRSPRWQALVHIETTARAILMGDAIPIEVDGIGLRNIEKIDEAEYRFLVAHRSHAAEFRPESPEAQPRKPVDYHSLKPRF